MRGMGWHDPPNRRDCAIAFAKRFACGRTPSPLSRSLCTGRGASFLPQQEASRDDGRRRGRRVPPASRRGPCDRDASERLLRDPRTRLGSRPPHGSGAPGPTRREGDDDRPKRSRPRSPTPGRKTRRHDPTHKTDPAASPRANSLTWRMLRSVPLDTLRRLSVTK